MHDGPPGGLVRLCTAAGPATAASGVCLVGRRPRSLLFSLSLSSPDPWRQKTSMYRIIVSTLTRHKREPRKRRKSPDVSASRFLLLFSYGLARDSCGRIPHPCVTVLHNPSALTMLPSLSFVAATPCLTIWLHLLTVIMRIGQIEAEHFEAADVLRIFSLSMWLAVCPIC